MNLRKISHFFCLPLILVLSACGAETDESPKVTEKPPILVETISISESRIQQIDLELAGVIASDNSTQVLAKTSGTATEVSFKLGDKVEKGKVLALIDDDQDNALRTSYETTKKALENTKKTRANIDTITNEQVRLAETAINQAEVGLKLAQSSDKNLRATSDQEIKQAEIARDQAKTAAVEAGSLADSTDRTADITVEQVKQQIELAEIDRVSKLDAAKKAEDDAEDNARLAVQSTINLNISILNSLNLITGFNGASGVSVAYADDLGNLNRQTYAAADSAFNRAWTAAEQDRRRSEGSIRSDLNNVKDTLELTLKALGTANYMLENTEPTADLPLVSGGGGGTSLTGLINQINGLQAQAGPGLSQIIALEQGLESLADANSTLGDTFDQAKELESVQLSLANQGLTSTKLGSKSQRNQSNFGSQLAENQLQIAKSRIKAQQESSALQVSLAEIQKQNAETALLSAKSNRQSQLDSIDAQIDQLDGQLKIAQIQLDGLSIESPISGTITSKFIEPGDTVAPGTPIAVISQTDRLKLQFYIDQLNIASLGLDQEVFVYDQHGETHRAQIRSISYAADPITKKFLVEAIILDDDDFLKPGVVVTVSLSINRAPRNEDSIFMPLSSVSVGQNESTVFIVDNNKAKKVPIEIDHLEGEFVEALLDAKDSTEIIINSGSILFDGAKITIKEKDEERE